jgi:hypothetical protein
MDTKKAERIDRGLRWLWVGPSAGIACMVALFCFGVVSGSAPLVTIASITAGMLGVTWASTFVALAGQRSKLVQR